jgi:hypothetical protein
MKHTNMNGFPAQTEERIMNPENSKRVLSRWHLLRRLKCEGVYAVIPSSLTKDSERLNFKN